MFMSKCSKNLYTSFLQASSIRYSGLALSEISPTRISHDSISRWLNSRCFRPREVFDLAKEHISLDEPCILIADDTVLSKPRSKEIELVHYQYSGNEHDVIPGIGLVNLAWHGLSSEETIPVDYRIYDKDSDGKTKNTHFMDMLKLAKERGISPNAVVMDSWYSSLDNLKCIRDIGWIWVTSLRKNRKVNRNVTLETLDIPAEGLLVHLRGYGWVTVFKFEAKNGRIDFITTNMKNPTREQVKKIMEIRWSIEVYHREIKQTCGIERCQALKSRAQRNHIFLAVAAWFGQYKIRIRTGTSFYCQQWNIIKSAISKNIKILMAYA